MLSTYLMWSINVSCYSEQSVSGLLPEGDKIGQEGWGISGIGEKEKTKTRQRPRVKEKFQGNKKEARESGEETFRYARWAADAAVAAAAVE